MSLYNAGPVALLVKSNLLAWVAVAAALAIGSPTAAGQNKIEDTRPSTSLMDGVPTAVDPNAYLIGPQDVLYIRVWREPDFTFTVAVRPDGKITVPLVGEVEAQQLTPGQLTSRLTELLAKYIQAPEVTVFVTEVRSKKYYIDGEVNRPGSYPLVTPLSVLEALSHGAGFRDFANTKRIRILRGDKIYYFNYRDVTSGKHLEQNIRVENGDHIIVR